MTTDHNIYALLCPECHEEAVIRAPRNWILAWGSAPAYSHTDGEPLCPVMTANGYQPAQPIEQTHDSNLCCWFPDTNDNPCLREVGHPDQCDGTKR